MKVDFICKECSSVETIEYIFKEGPPKEVKCSFCDGIMKRSFKHGNAGSAIVPDCFTDDVFTNISLRMKNNLPTGKDHNIF